MHQIIAGVLIGAAAIMFGPRLLSDIAVTLRPVGKGLLYFGDSVAETVSGSVSTAGGWVGGWFGSGTETGQTISPAPSSESETEQKEREFPPGSGNIRQRHRRRIS